MPMRIFLSAGLFFLFSIWCRAEIPGWLKKIHQKRADSLQMVLQTTTDPKLKVDILNQMAPLVWDISLEKSYDIAMEANILSIKNENIKGLMDSYTNLAIITEYKKQYRISIFYWEQAIIQAEKSGDIKSMARQYVAILNSCFYLGDYRKVIEVSLKGIPIARKARDLDAEIHFMNSLGFVFVQQDKLEIALKCYSQSLLLSKKLGNVSLIGKSYSNVGKIYGLQGHYSKAIQYYKQAINILKDTEWVGDYASSLNGLAKVYLSGGNYDQALYYALKCADFVDNRGGQNIFDMVDYHLTLGEIYYALHQYDLASKWLFMGLNKAIAIGHKEFSKRGYKDLSDLFAHQKKYDQAYEYQSKYIVLKDSLSGIETTKKMAALESQAEIDKKDYDIQILSTEKKLDNIRHKRGNLIRNISLGFLLLISIISFLIYNRHSLRQKNKLLAEIGNQQVKMFNTVVSMQDKERKRIAEDLHDGLGSTLSTIQLNLERMKDKKLEMDQSQMEQYNLALSLSNEAVTELRNIAHNLMPSTLTKLGLVAALKNHITQTQKHSGIQIKIENHGLDQRIDPNMEMSIFRIMLEILNNAVKHSKATEVLVQFVKFDDHLNITVEDNGIGFDPDKTTVTKGMGIRNMASRLEFMNGTYSIDSSKGFGTTYIIDIPFKQN